MRDKRAIHNEIELSRLMIERARAKVSTSMRVLKESSSDIERSKVNIALSKLRLEHHANPETGNIDHQSLQIMLSDSEKITARANKLLESFNRGFLPPPYSK